MSKEDLNDYVEIALSFRMVCKSLSKISIKIFLIKIISKYREFIQHIRNSTKSILSSNGQASISNSIVLIPIAANAINELNTILNRLMRIAFTIEAESNYLRQPPTVSIPIDNKELYQQNTKDIPINETISDSQIESTTSQGITSQSGLNLKRNTYSLLKQNQTRSNIRNQSAISNVNSFKLTPNIIANIFEDFFNEY
jgi:hypothetical protein